MTLFDLFKKFNPDTFPVSPSNPENFDESPQDADVKVDDIVKTELGEYNTRSRDLISNVFHKSGPNITRHNSPFLFFLDGCRRAYYLCDIATSSGKMLPILAGQVSSAVIKRSKDTGHVSLFRHETKGLLLLPVGGGGINSEDAKAIKSVIDESFSEQNLTAKCIDMRHDDEPKNDSLAHLNMEMQSLEIKFLEEMTNDGIIYQNRIIVVDGALQFQNIRKERRSCLRYAVGISKRFNLRLKHIISKTREVGTHLINLKNVGDRTSAFLLKTSDAKYSFWYLRIHPLQRTFSPFAGIVKIEKVLVDEKEQEYGLPTDVVDNISLYVLLERNVNPYGIDLRWASHIYPIYLTEKIQHNKFVSDYFYRTVLKRKVNI